MVAPPNKQTNPVMRRIKLVNDFIENKMDGVDELQKKRLMLWGAIGVSFLAPSGYITFNENETAQDALAGLTLMASLFAAQVYAGKRDMNKIKKWSDLGYYALERLSMDEEINELYRNQVENLKEGGLLAAQSRLNGDLEQFSIDELSRPVKAIDMYPFIMWLGAQGSGKTTAAGRFLSSCRGVRVAITHHFSMGQFEAADYRIVPHLDPQMKRLIEQAEQDKKNIAEIELSPEMSRRLAEAQEKFIFDRNADPDLSWKELINKARECDLNNDDTPRFSKFISSSLIQTLFSLAKEAHRRKGIKAQAEAMGKEPDFESLEIVIDEALTLYAFLQQAGAEMRQKYRQGKDEDGNDIPWEVLNPEKFWSKLLLEAATEWRKYKMRLSIIAHVNTLKPLGLESLGELRDTFLQIKMMDMGLEHLESLIPKKERATDAAYLEFYGLVAKRNSWKNPIAVMINDRPYRMTTGETMHKEVKTYLVDWMSRMLEQVRFQSRMVKENPAEYGNWKGTQQAYQSVSESGDGRSATVAKKVIQTPVKVEQVETSEPVAEKKITYEVTPQDIQEYLEKIKTLSRDPSIAAQKTVYARLLGLPTSGGDDPMRYPRTSAILDECYTRMGQTQESIAAYKDKINQWLFDNCGKLDEAAAAKLMERFDWARAENTYPSAYQYAKAMGFPMSEDELAGIHQLVTEPGLKTLRLIYIAFKMRRTSWKALFQEWKRAKK